MSVICIFYKESIVYRSAESLHLWCFIIILLPVIIWIHAHSHTHQSLYSVLKKTDCQACAFTSRKIKLGRHNLQFNICTNMSTHLIGQCIKYCVAVDNLWQTQYSEVIAECLRGSQIFFIYVGTGYLLVTVKVPYRVQSVFGGDLFIPFKEKQLSAIYNVH